ncbi:MAG: hypothetical protein HWE30_04855 [Methylocystaceae bacterium]|nr:hypothetical protein [Methylocystaceae bacterium]
MDEVTLARIIHVLGVIIWGGGIGFLVIILMPRLRSNPTPSLQFQFFLSVARPFAAWMRYVSLAVGLSGFAMLHFLSGWDRYLDFTTYWWVHLMTATWLVYSALLLRQFINTRRKCTPQLDDAAATFRLHKVSRMQRNLFILTVITAASALYGVHGSW